MKGLKVNKTNKNLTFKGICVIIYTQIIKGGFDDYEG